MSYSTRAATYKVIINTLKGLPLTTLDAAFGLVGLFFLYAIRYACEYLSKRYPRRGEFAFLFHLGECFVTDVSLARVFFFISVLRNAFVLIVLTIASWLYTRHRKNSAGSYPIKILKTVPSGLRHVHAPTIDSGLITALAPELPVATIILLLEHIAISKCMSRLNFLSRSLPVLIIVRNKFSIWSC